MIARNPGLRRFVCVDQQHSPINKQATRRSAILGHLHPLFVPLRTFQDKMTSYNPRPFIRAILVDISGTLQVGSRPTHNAVGALGQLRAASIPFRLCSNNSKESTDVLIKKLDLLGFCITPNSNSSRREVWTSIGAVRQVLDDMGLKRCGDPKLCCHPSYNV